MSRPQRDIPLRNIFYMLAYAWNQSAFKDRVSVGHEFDGPDTPDFFARILCLGCDRLFQRGLDRAYISMEDEIVGLRGKIRVGETLLRDILRKGRTLCEFEELRCDVLHNRLIKAALSELAMARTLTAATRKKLNETIRRFDERGVSDIHATRQAFRQVQLHRNNAFYAFLLRVAEFVIAEVFPAEKDETGVFARLLENEEKLNHIFESFVRNFFRAEQSVFALRDAAERLEWDIGKGKRTEDERFLPGMYPDMTLRGTRKTIVIDAKYYRNVFTSRMEGAASKLHSGNLYQLFSYVKNLEANGGNDAEAEGILLYPQVTEPVHLTYKIQDHTIRICMIDLAAPWQRIEESLLGLIGLKLASAGAA